MMNQLVHFENAKRELQLATNVDEVKDLRDKAEALRLYMKQAGESLWMQNQCAEIKVRAERRAGELLKATVKPGNPQLSHDVTIKTLPDGISRKQSSRWQAWECLPTHQAEGVVTGRLTVNVLPPGDNSPHNCPATSRDSTGRGLRAFRVQQKRAFMPRCLSVHRDKTDTLEYINKAFPIVGWSSNPAPTYAPGPGIL